MADVPAVVHTGRLDVVAITRLGHAVFTDVFIQPQRPANLARFVFLEPRAEAFYQDWEDAARQTVAVLRAEAGRNPHDRALSDLVGELSTRSESFRTLWAAHDVREHRTGLKRTTHPVVGDMDLAYEALNLSNDRDLLLIA